MKTYLPYLALFPLFFLFISCAETEDVKMGSTDGADLLLRIESLVEQLENLERGVPEDWEQTKDPVERAAYARFMFSTGIIPISLDLSDINPYLNDRFILSEYYPNDRIILSEYYRVVLIKRFGDIPQVHTLADYTLKVLLGILSTDTELNAVVKAHAFLFPDSPKMVVHDGAIHDLQQRTRTEELLAVAKLRKEDPQKWVDHNRAQLIKEHGDTPDVRMIADFMEKIELGHPITEAEYGTYLAKLEELQPGWLTRDQNYVKLEAKDQLGIWMRDLERCTLESYRLAKANGTPFDMILSDLNEEHPLCQSVKRGAIITSINNIGNK